MPRSPEPLRSLNSMLLELEQPRRKKEVPAPQANGRREPARRVNRLAASIAVTMAQADLRNGTLSLLDQAVVSGTSFATSVIIGRTCSQEELGIFYLALTIVCMARGIQEHLISAPYVIYCHRCRDERKALYEGSALLHHLALSGAALVALLGLLGLLSLGIGPVGFAPAVWALLGALPLVQLREFIRRLSIAHLRMFAAIAIDIGVALVQIGGLLLLVYFQQLTVGLAYAMMGAACLVACSGWFLAKRRPFQIAWSEVVTDWRRNWGFARWALAGHVIGFATLYLTPWIVTAVRGSAEAGILAACINIVGVASMFMTGLSAFLIPRATVAFAQGGVRKLRGVLRAAELAYAAVLGAFALFVLASGDSLLVLAFGKQYSGYGAVVGVLALSMMAQSMGLTAGIGLWAIDRPDANLAADASTLVVTLVLVLCFLPSLGVLGAALGDLGGRVVGGAIRHGSLRACLEVFPCTAEAR
jgi:O-antigen/teichoic acid export membrane protein